MGCFRRDEGGVFRKLPDALTYQVKNLISLDTFEALHGRYRPFLRVILQEFTPKTQQNTLFGLFQAKISSYSIFLKVFEVTLPEKTSVAPE